VSNAIFHIDLLKNYQVLDRPGTFMTSVAYTVTTDNLYVKDDYPRFLIPLRVIRADDLPNLIKILKDNEIVTFNSIRHLFLTGAIFDNGDVNTSLLPIKGEQVLTTFENKNDTILCTHVELIDRESLTYVNFDAIDDLYSLAKNFLYK